MGLYLMGSSLESIFSVSNDPNKAGKDIRDAMGVTFTLQALGVPEGSMNSIVGDCTIKDGEFRYDPRRNTSLILAPKKYVKDQLENLRINGINAVGVDLYMFHKGSDTLPILNDKTFCKNIDGYRIILMDYLDISNININSGSHIVISSSAPVSARNLNVNCNILTINAPMALSGILGTVRDSIWINLDKRQGPNRDRVFEELFKISYRDYKKQWYYNQMLDIPSDILSHPFCDVSHIKVPRIEIQFGFNDGHRILFIAQKYDFGTHRLKFIEGATVNAMRINHYRHYRRFYKLADIDGWHCLLYTDR